MNLIPRYKHKCPGCGKIVLSQVMYCFTCKPRNSGYKLRDGQQKWLKGIRLVGVIPTKARLIVLVDTKNYCIECGAVLSCGIKHKCYSRSRATGFTGATIKCSVCKERKVLKFFSVVYRRISKDRTVSVRLGICNYCLDGKRIYETEPYDLPEMRA